MPVVVKQGPAGGAIKVIPKQGDTQARMQAVIDRFLQMIADAGVAEIKMICQSGIFKHPTGSLANSIQGAVEGGGVVWWSDAEYASPQEHGVRPHQMWYLLNKTIPITLHKYGGSVKIYRKATLKSILAGKWYHKGYPGKYFLKRGVETTISKIPEILEKAHNAIIQIGV